MGEFLKIILKEIKEEENFQLFYFYIYGDKKYTTRILHLSWFQIYNLFSEHSSAFRDNELFLDAIDGICVFRLGQDYPNIRGYDHKIKYVLCKHNILTSLQRFEVY